MRYPIDIAECHKIIRAQQAKIDEQAEKLRAWADYDACIGNAPLTQWAGNIRRYFVDNIYNLSDKEKKLSPTAPAARILVAATQREHPSCLQLWQIVNTIKFHKSYNYDCASPRRSVGVMIFKARLLFNKLGLDDPFVVSWGEAVTLTEEAMVWVNRFKPVKRG